MSCRRSITIIWITLMSIVLVAAAQAADMRIVNGYITDISQTQYLVQLRSPIDGGAFCGGTLVTPLHVVTAAHCLGVYKNEDIIMVAGTAMKFGNTGVERRIIAAHIHPEYSRETMHADVAVLKLNQPMVGRNIKTVPLCSRSLKPNEYFLISGFGRTADDEPGSKVLRSASVPTMSFEECSYRYVDRITDAMMCAYTNGRDACEGDSGGPGVFNGQLCAIVSWGAKCGDDYFPGVYTNVYAVRGFIEKAIRK